MSRFLSLDIPMIALKDGESWTGHSEHLGINLPPKSRADCLEELCSAIIRRTSELVVVQGHRTQYFTDLGICSAILGTPGPDDSRLPGISDGITGHCGWDDDLTGDKIEGKLCLTIQIDEQ